MHRSILAAFVLALSALAVSCGGSGGVSSASNGTGSNIAQLIATCEQSLPQLPAPTVANQVPVIADFGPCAYGVPFGSPAGTAASVFVVGAVNAPFTNVTICVPGTTTCQTIDHVLIDTGSYGLRIMSSVLNANMALPAVSVGSAPLIECVQFADGYSWGSIRGADVRMSGEVATGVAPVGGIPVQVIGDSSAYTVPAACTGTAPSPVLAPLNDVASFGANGVLGVGLFNQDCGATCVTYAGNSFYYACPTASGCTGSTAALNEQTSNPVAFFALDNQGVVLTMPPLADSTGAVNMQGTLSFGINTQTNNTTSGVAGLNVYQASAQGNFFSTLMATTGYTVSSTTYTSSFIDSGSNGIYLPGTTIPSDPTYGWFIPTVPSSIIQVTATQQGTDSTGTVATGNINTLKFDVANANTVLFTNANASDTVFNGLAAPATTGNITTGGVDWGLPFFFGKSIYVVLENRVELVNATTATGPFWAF